ncbi:MAG: hypothetical protein Q7S88_03445 [Candidatus Daviesbacteria bacterium]|nr:hypothetical protein [Candidatus Daviesbacteria bacterium]
MKRLKKSYKPWSIRKSERKSRNKLVLTIIILGTLFYASVFWLLPFLIGSLTFFNNSTDNTPTLSISENTTLAPPVLNIPFESTNSAKISVQGYALALSEVEIYLDDIIQDTVKTREDGTFKSSEIELNLGTNNLYGKTIDEKGIKSLPSKTIKVIFDNEKPKLELTEPEEGRTITGGDKKVKVSGKVAFEEQITVTINNSRIIVNSESNFSQIVELSDGENEIVIEAKDLAGNITRLSRKVIYNP